MRVGAYYAFVKGEDYALPYRESIRLASEAFDQVLVATDPRFEDGTLEELETLAEGLKNVDLIQEEIDFDAPAPLGMWKTAARRKAQGNEWLVEMEPWWVFDPTLRERLNDHLTGMHPTVLCVGVGAINLFNGDNVKGVQPPTLPVVSRDHPAITHGGKDRVGAGLVVRERIPLRQSAVLTTEEWRETFECPRAVWLWNYEFYSLPTTYEMKTWWHYFKGKEEEKYASIAEYEINLDGEPVDMFAPNYQLPPDMYEEQVGIEMRDSSIRQFYLPHLPALHGWLAEQRVVTPPKWVRLCKVRRKVKKEWRKLRWKVSR